MKIAIVIVNFNGKDDTIECLKSLREIEHPSHQIIVVDNGSTDDPVTAIEQNFSEVIVIPAKKNLGFAGGNNLGIARALEEGAKAVLLLNNDTIISPEILQAFEDAHHQTPQALLGAKIFQYHDPQRLDHLGGNWNHRTASFDLIGKNKSDSVEYQQAMDMDYICGCALFIPSEVFSKIGFLEPQFFLYWEDSDFCARAKRAGFSIKLCPGAIVWHKGSATTQRKSALATYFWWRNRLLWMQRNLPKDQYLKIRRRVIYPQLLRLIKHLTIRSLIWHVFMRHKRTSPHYLRRETSLVQYRAAAKGARDFFRGKRGNSFP